MVNDQAVEHGTNTAVAIMYTAIFTGVMLLAIALVFSAIASTEISQNGYVHNSGTVSNETIGPVTEVGSYLSLYSLSNVACSVGVITTQSNGVKINPTGNYTTSNCKITALATELILTPGSVVNESTVKVINETGVSFSKSTLKDVVCTITSCINKTDKVFIPTADWVNTSCGVKYVQNTTGNIFNNTVWNCSYTYTYTAPNPYNNTNWNVSYIYTYTSTNTTTVIGLGDIQSNVVGMVINFFALMPTVGTILAVVILIAGIVILVLYVRRMKDSGQEHSGEFQG